jgi:hypothetical protein
MQHPLPLTWTDTSAECPEAAELTRFLLGFSLDDLPACSTGMALLMKFAKGKPIEYATARCAGFTTCESCSYATSPQWRAFARHRGRCYDCCECVPAIGYDYFRYKPPTAAELRAYEAASKGLRARVALQAYHDALGAIGEQQRAGRATTPQRRQAIAARRVLDAALGLRTVGKHIN